MKHLSKYFLVALFAIAFYGVSFVDLGPNGTVSVAEAHHKPGHACKGNKCGPPPTVSELPIQYMVAGGIAFILISGGIVYLTRNRSKKHPSEV